VRDGLSNTLLLVEVKESAIGWLEPRDLSFDDLQRGAIAPGKPGWLTSHPGCFQAAFADGTTRTIGTDIFPDILRSLFTRAGGETIPADGW
jgi:hypothetical protein